MPGQDEWLSPARVQKPAYSSRLPNSQQSDQRRIQTQKKAGRAFTRPAFTLQVPADYLGQAFAFTSFSGAGMRPVMSAGIAAPPGTTQTSTLRYCARVSDSATA